VLSSSQHTSRLSVFNFYWKKYTRHETGSSSVHICKTILRICVRGLTRLQSAHLCSPACMHAIYHRGDNTTVQRLQPQRTGSWRIAAKRLRRLTQRKRNAAIDARRCYCVFLRFDRYVSCGRRVRCALILAYFSCVRCVPACVFPCVSCVFCVRTCVRNFLASPACVSCVRSVRVRVASVARVASDGRFRLQVRPTEANKVGNTNRILTDFRQ